MNRDQVEGQVAEAAGRHLSPRLVVALVIAVLSAIFIFQNTEKGTIHFLFFDWTVGVWSGLLVAFVLGAVMGRLVPRLLRRKKDDDD